MPGVSAGAPVTFNGVRVGEVTRIGFNPRDPNEVLATIAIDALTPVRVDTQVGVDNQGPDRRRRHCAARRRRDVAGADQRGRQAASAYRRSGARHEPRRVRQRGFARVDKVVAEDADPLHATLSNLQVFTDALSRNSGRLDGILQGLERMTGGGPPAEPPTTYDLALPTSLPQFKKIEGRLVVADPGAVVMYDSQHILERGKDGGFTFLADAQWSDSLAKLVQAKLLEAFENAQMFSAVSRPVEGENADSNQLAIDIRTFSVASSPKPTAEVALGAKLISADGKVVAEQTFRRTAPIASLSASDAVAGLNDAFVGVTSDIIAWTSQSL